MFILNNSIVIIYRYLCSCYLCKVIIFSFQFLLAFEGFYNDLIPQTLLERWKVVFPEYQQQKHDIWWKTNQKDLGARCVFCPFQAIIYTWYHDGKHYAACISRWECAIQPKVRRLQIVLLHAEWLINIFHYGNECMYVFSSL